MFAFLLLNYLDLRVEAHAAFDLGLFGEILIIVLIIVELAQSPVLATSALLALGRHLVSFALRLIC